MGLLGDKFIIFDQKLKKHTVFGWQSKILKSFWAKSELKKGVLGALHRLPSNMGVSPPPGKSMPYAIEHTVWAGCLWATSFHTLIKMRVVHYYLI